MITIALAICVPIALFGIIYYTVVTSVPAYTAAVPDYVPTVIAMCCRVFSELVPLTLRFVPVESGNRLERAMLDETLLVDRSTL